MLGNLSLSQALGAAPAGEGGEENSFSPTRRQVPGGGAASCLSPCGSYSLKTATGHKEMDFFFFLIWSLEA